MCDLEYINIFVKLKITGKLQKEVELRVRKFKTKWGVGVKYGI
jgi:hypothetical protein